MDFTIQMKCDMHIHCNVGHTMWDRLSVHAVTTEAGRLRDHAENAVQTSSLFLWCIQVGALTCLYKMKNIYMYTIKAQVSQRTTGFSYQ